MGLFLGCIMNSKFRFPKNCGLHRGREMDIHFESTSLKSVTALHGCKCHRSIEKEKVMRAICTSYCGGNPARGDLAE